MPFGWGIVSTGKHPDVKIAPAMAAAADGGELVGVYSRDQQRAEAFAQKHGARAAYSQLGDLLKDSRVDGVFVASPNALHAEHVVQAAEAGKHVLCEKPMATTIADAVRMLQACRRAASRSAWPSTCASTRPISARASSSPPGRWGASCSPRRSGRSACAAATARRRARLSVSGTRRS